MVVSALVSFGQTWSGQNVFALHPYGTWARAVDDVVQKNLTIHDVCSNTGMDARHEELFVNMLNEMDFRLSYEMESDDL